MAKRVTDESPNRPRLGGSAIANMFRKGPFLPCLLELIKNATDANARKIWFTTADRSQFRMVDDGRGMDERGRRAYLDAGYSTGDGTTSAMFGTGARYFPFSFASHFVVSTVSVTEPNVVYQCEFEMPRDLMEYFLNQRDITWHRVRKTSATWGHEHPTGVDVTYTYEKPSAKRILRGKSLVECLTDRLDIGMVESGMIHVDGQPLPKKQFASGTRPRMFVYQDSELPGMGFVKLEFYRPDKLRKYTDLLMTDRTVGEVSFRNKFVRQLPDDAPEQVPPLFLQSGVCGLITAGYLNNHVTNNREEYQGAEDDERTYELLRMLWRVQDEVGEALGIKLHRVDESDAVGRKEVIALLDHLDSRYNHEGQAPSPVPGGDTIGPGGTTTGGGRTRFPYFKLNRNEFELGETVEAKLVVPQGSPDDYDISYDDALAKFIGQLDDGTARLVTESIGTGKLLARHRKTGVLVRGRYQIIPERWFRLQVNTETNVGERVVATALNIDKVPGGAISWELTDGPGTLTVGPGNRSAVFVSNQVGISTIVAYATSQPDSIRDERDIRVARRDMNTAKVFCIRGEFFAVHFDGVLGQARFSKPVTIIRNEGQSAHRLTFTTDEPGYAKAHRDGSLASFLIPWIAREFADHFYDRDTEDPEIAQWEVARLAAEVAAEMYGAKVVDG